MEVMPYFVDGEGFRFGEVACGVECIWSCC